MYSINIHLYAFCYLSQSCYTFYSRLSLGGFIRPDTFRSVSLLRGMSPSKIGQWDSSSAPKGAGSRSRAARPTQKQKHTYCCKPPQSSADTAWRTKWAAKRTLISSSLSLPLLLCCRLVPGHMEPGQGARGRGRRQVAPTGRMDLQGDGKREGTGTLAAL